MLVGAALMAYFTDLAADELDWDDDHFMDQLYELDSELRNDLSSTEPDGRRMRVVIPGDFDEPILIWEGDDGTTIIQQGERNKVCVKFEEITVCR